VFESQFKSGLNALHKKNSKLPTQLKKCRKEWVGEAQGPLWQNNPAMGQQKA